MFRKLLMGTLMLPSIACASNGVYTTGYGGVSSTMAGTDLALAHDISALVTNPAGLAALSRPQLDVYLSPFHTLGFGFADENGNQRRLNNKMGALAGGGFILPLDRYPGWVAAVGLAAQGGVGYEYRDVNTAFGGQDDLLALFGVYKLSAGLAWQADERLRVGLVLDVIHANVRQNFFANTSVFDPENPAASFFGLRADGLTSWRVGARAGLQYQATDTLTIGAAYAPRTALPLSGGSVTANYEALGEGRVRYRSANLDGLALPQEAGIAVAWTGIDGLLLTAEGSWFEWSRSVAALNLNARDPDTSKAPAATIDVPTQVGARDRVVWSAAAAYAVTPRATLRAGYSYNGQMQPSETLSPIFALIARRTYAVGASYELPPKWTLYGGVEYQPYNSRYYRNPDLPLFGDEAKTVNQCVYAHLMISRRW